MATMSSAEMVAILMLFHSHSSTGKGGCTRLPSAAARLRARSMSLADRVRSSTPTRLSCSALAWAASRRGLLALGCTAALALLGLFGLWDDTLKTLAMVAVATLLAVAIGAPLGVGMARWPWLRRGLSPLLDLLQTLPSFVYLIPAVMLLGIGRVPGLLAVLAYALPPMVRPRSLSAQSTRLIRDMAARLKAAEALAAPAAGTAQAAVEPQTTGATTR